MNAATNQPVPAKHPDWTDVMTGLVGVRLAAYDELLVRGTLGAETLAALVRNEGGPDELLAAVAWLIEHRMVIAQDGVWRAVGIARARQVWEEFGPAPATGPGLATEFEPGRGGAPSREDRGRFAMREGDNTAVRSDILKQVRAVHACGLLDLGDY